MNFRSGTAGVPPVVKNLIIINALVFMAQAMLPGGMGNALTSGGALYFWGSDHFRIYQFLTSIFLHGGLFHLFFNMFALWMFGRVLEYDLGSKRFLIFYLVCGVGANLFFSGANWLEIMMRQAPGANPYEAGMAVMRIVNTPALGASGAIYGILLAFGMLHPNATLMLLIPPIPMKAKYFVVVFMVIEFFAGFSMNDGVAHFAHVGGMLWGFLVLRWWKRTGKIYY